MMNKLILTIDLEWYYNGDKYGNIADFPKRSLKERFDYDNGQIEKSVETILNILEKYNQKITFFVVAEIDKVYPRVLKKIFDNGHEIAVHSYRHDELSEITNFEVDLQKCIFLQKKYKVVGFRTTRIKIRKEHYLSLNEFGYKYDSSVYGTTKFDFAGVKILPVSVLPFKKSNIQSIPSSLNVRLFKRSIPFGSGLFMGFLQKFEQYFISKYTKTYKEPPCLFLHSWQIKKPYYPLKFLLKNPAMFPHFFECRGLLEYFCKNYQLIRIKDYLL